MTCLVGEVGRAFGSGLALARTNAKDGSVECFVQFDTPYLVSLSFMNTSPYFQIIHPRGSFVSSEDTVT